jgi:hypothetical protein
MLKLSSSEWQASDLFLPEAISNRFCLESCGRLLDIRTKITATGCYLLLSIAAVLIACAAVIHVDEHAYSTIDAIRIVPTVGSKTLQTNIITFSFPTTVTRPRFGRAFVTLNLTNGHTTRHLQRMAYPANNCNSVGPLPCASANGKDTVNWQAAVGEDDLGPELTRDIVNVRGTVQTTIDRHSALLVWYRLLRRRS